MGLSIANVSTDLKRHVADNPTIYQEKMVSMEDEFTNKGITIFNDVVDEMPLYKLDVADPGQPGNRATPNFKSNVVAFSNRTLKVKPAEVTLKFTNVELEAMYKSHLNQMRNAAARGSVYDVPFEDVIMTAIISKFMDRIATVLAFKGAFDAAGTTTADIADGWETILAALITATTVPANRVFTGAAITAATALAQFNGVNDQIVAIDPEYVDKVINVYCAPENVKHYRTGYRTAYASLPYNTEFKKNFLDDDTNRPLIPMQGLAGSDRLIMSTPGNLVIGTDAMSRLSNIDIEKRGRDLFVYIDGKIGFDFIMSSEIWANNLA
jgi:hypothetical protein